MKNFTLLEKARYFAKWAHHGQRRKFGQRSYIYHPACVYKILKEDYPESENLLCSSWLHDTLEDCPSVSYKLLGDEFNYEIASLVDQVTHPVLNPKPPRKQRWKIYLNHYANASEEGKILKLADRMANLQEYIDYFHEIDKDGKKFLARVYLSESLQLLERLTSLKPNLVDYRIDIYDKIMWLTNETRYYA